MSILFECPNCGQTYDAGEHLAGKGMRCRNCQAIMRVPDLPSINSANTRKSAPAPSPPASATPPPVSHSSPPDDPSTGLDSDADLPFALADDDPSIPIPILPVSPPAPSPIPAPTPATGRPAPLPRLSFGTTPTSAAPVQPTGSTSRRSARSSSTAASPSPDREEWSADSGQLLKLGAAGLFALISLLAVARVLFFSGSGSAPEETIVLDSGPDFGPSAPGPRNQASSPTTPSAAPLPPILSPASPPSFPQIGPGFEIERGVFWQKIKLLPPRSSIGDPPPGSLMTLWLYLPAGQHPPASLPCILIAPAGSTLLTGKSWSEPDPRPASPFPGQADASAPGAPVGDEGRHPEHLPYVRAGFAVLGYELDGAVPENYSQGQFLSGVRRFLAARAGLTNAHVAIDFLKARVPQVDPKRLYTAGHSSAATTALIVAANEPGIAACVAFSPCIDIKARFQRATGDADAVINDLRRAVPGAEALFTIYSPLQNLDRLSCPVFVMHAEDDTNIPISDSRALVERSRPGQVTMLGVSTGGHYQPMINGGIDAAIKWLIDQGARPVPPGLAPPAVKPPPTDGSIPGV